MRGLLILLVTLGHTLQWTSREGGPDGSFRDPLFVAIYLFHVPLFFAISGLLLGRSERTGPPRSRLPGRILRMAVPTLVWFTLTTIGLRFCKALATGTLNTSIPDWGFLGYALTLHGWYVWCLCMFNAVLLLPGRSLRTRAWVLGAVGLASLLLPDGDFFFFLPYSFAFLIPGFLLGLGHEGRQWQPRWWLRGLLILASILIGYTWSTGDFIYFRSWSLHVDSPQGILLRFLRQALVTFTAADLLWLLSQGCKLELLAWLGDRTLFIYLSQNLFILASLPLWRSLPLERHGVLWPLCIGVALLTCMIALGLERLAARHRISAFLLGTSSLPDARMRH